MKRLAIFLVGCILLMGAVPAGASPLFKDLPEKHWALDAVNTLAARGILEGYPDGTFKGDRSATRWEVAMMIARVLAQLEQSRAEFASKADYDAVMSLAKAYQDELAAYGVRTTAVEDAYGKLDARTKALEKITFYGDFDTIYADQSLGGNLPGVGSALVPGIDFSSGRILTTGRVITSLLNLGVNARVTDALKADLRIASFAAQGDPLMELYWGVTAPYLSNAYCVATTSPLLTNNPWTRTTLDSFTLTNEPTKLEVRLGSFRPDYIDPAVLYGARNPNYHGPVVLPFYGAKVRGQLSQSANPITFEAVYSRLAQGSAYNTWFGAGNMEMDFPLGTIKGHLALNFLKTSNVDQSQGAVVGTGGVALPAALTLSAGGWLDARNNVVRPSVGPQDQTTAGAGLTFTFPHDWQFIMDYATSNYNPDTRKLPAAGFDTTTNGTMYRLALSGNWARLGALLEYVKADPTYDPMMLPYSTPAGLPVFLPYSSYYSNYYQLHDYITYPNNRQGVRLTANYRTDNTIFSGNYGDLEQVNPSTLSNLRAVGFIEPLFLPPLTMGGSQKGRVTNWGLGVNHIFKGGLQAYLGYFNYAQRRSAPGPDDINLKENYYNVNLGYPFSQKFNVFVGYTWLDYSGNTAGGNLGFTQNIPTIGFSYAPGPNSSLYMTYKLFDFHNTVAANGDYKAYQTLMEYQVKF